MISQITSFPVALSCVLAAMHFGIAAAQVSRDLEASDPSSQTTTIEVDATGEELTKIAALFGYEYGGANILRISAGIKYVGDSRSEFLVDLLPQGRLRLDKLCVMEPEVRTGRISGQTFSFDSGNLAKQHYVWLSDPVAGCRVEKYEQRPPSVAVPNTLSENAAISILEQAAALYNAVAQQEGITANLVSENFRFGRLSTAGIRDPHVQYCADVIDAGNEIHYEVCFSMQLEGLRVSSVRKRDWLW